MVKKRDIKLSKEEVGSMTDGCESLLQLVLASCEMDPSRLHSSVSRLMTEWITDKDKKPYEDKVELQQMLEVILAIVLKADRMLNGRIYELPEGKSLYDLLDTGEGEVIN